MKLSHVVTRAALAALLILTFAPAGSAHDLQENRAQLVLRDGRHLTVTLFVSYEEALRLALAPQRPPAEFLVMYSAMKPELFQKELQRAQSRFQAAIRISLPDGKELPLTNWNWPDASQVQSLLQRRIMQAMVDPTGHGDPLEIHADAVARDEITTLKVQFPEEFQTVLVVSYKPSQVWVAPKAPSPAIQF